ncbi:MAG: hypothetical protein Q4D02_01335 [Clostridia bacterium]|nr:hypothetical protein [Clostridia bacterium]
MKYIITKSNVSNAEIKARMEYIYDSFHIYTLVDSVNSNKDITILNTIPEDAIDLFMIVGHDRRTDEYIRANYKKIKENNIVIISCNTPRFSSLKLLKDKNVFLPKNGGIIDFYDGENYGFSFNITDEEIILYRNRNEKMEIMLKNTFERS